MTLFIIFAVVLALKGAHLVLTRTVGGPSFQDFNTTRPSRNE
jgi:hypothetical protein